MATKDITSVFSDSYEQAQGRFFRAANARPWRVRQSFSNSAAGENAVTDVFRFGPDKARAVLIVSSGLHGIEGFAGSAIQLHAVAENLLTPLPKDMAVVYVHALNPYGFANFRRVNENNVDLNRNFIDWSRIPPPDHALTSELNRILLPEDWDDAMPGLYEFSRKHNMATLQKALTQGQYTNPQGLFYGGNDASWTHTTWMKILERQASAADFIAHVDIHTGLGPSGYGEIIMAAPSASADGQRAKDWWGRSLRFIADGNAASSVVSGAIEQSFNAAALIAKPREIASVTLEFGTQPPLRILEALAFDNWVRVRRPGNERAVEKARDMMRDAFNPGDGTWWEKIIERGSEVLLQAKKGLENRL